jgi:hypothetical protein
MKHVPKYERKKKKVIVCLFVVAKWRGREGKKLKQF